MATKADVVKSLKKQNLVSDPESWMKLAAMVACSIKKVRDGEAIDEAVRSCYQEIK